ncbi:MAG: double-strand break repair protein AddB [Rhodobacteraceae bacterium]|nr:double-strand break repair protein AddB [Paracoccaceae bacterium]
MARGGIWGIDPGADFPAVFVAGLLERFAETPPEAQARTRIYLNTGRMLRRVHALLAEGPARLLPRLALVTDLGRDVALGPLPPARSALRRRLELTRLVEGLIAAQPDIAPRAAAFDLAGSLAALLDEMQGEGVGFHRIAGLDVSDQSGHWARSQRFLGLLSGYLAETGSPPDAEGRQRIAVETLARRWASAPPADPVIIAGSTGSRGTTRLLMEAVLRLPQGHVVLPGFDFAMPDAAWAGLTAPERHEDHPQFRYADLLQAVDRPADAVAAWHDIPPPDPPRNALVSLALRPAPVTDRWQVEGPHLGELGEATAGMTLIEAPDPRAEATAVALILRDAAERGTRVALISPDRMLTRRVTAMLDKWGIEPDDSAGAPLTQSPTGRLLRQLAALWTAPPDPAALIALFKHPLVHSVAGRGDHLRHSRDFELWQRRRGPAFPTGETLRGWAHRFAPDAAEWADWIAAILDDMLRLPERTVLATRVEVLLETHRRLVSGAMADPLAPTTEAQLWSGPDGRDARMKCAALETEAMAGGAATGSEFAALLRAVLAGEVRDPTSPHPGVMIWGTLEARVQGADLVVLGGLTDGIWPPAPDPDPWLNRRMRAEAGLLSPERRIGLSAHDFQQAVAASQVVLSRPLRDNEAPTVPSRWLNRLVCLLGGLPDQGGDAALDAMRDRGRSWLELANRLDAPQAHGVSLARAPRPSPKPPAGTAPARISVSDVERLIRDPYALYASRVLRLAPLDPLHRTPDPALRGTVLHRVLERAGPELATLDVPMLLDLSAETLEDLVPWPHTRALWQARMARVAEWFLAGEQVRLRAARPARFESAGALPLGTTGVTLTSKADRIDMRDDGGLNLYDYKTGAPPSPAQQATFHKQLLLVAAMSEAGAYEGVPPRPVAEAAYIGLGAAPKIVPAPLDEQSPAETLARVAALLAAHIAGTRGYTARRAPEQDAHGGDFDHLARLGEWDITDVAVTIPVGEHGDG